MAVLAPMPSASVKTTSTVNPGDLPSIRKARRKFFMAFHLHSGGEKSYRNLARGRRLTSFHAPHLERSVTETFERDALGGGGDLGFWSGEIAGDFGVVGRGAREDDVGAGAEAAEPRG